MAGYPTPRSVPTNVQRAGSAGFLSGTLSEATGQARCRAARREPLKSWSVLRARSRQRPAGPADEGWRALGDLGCDWPAETTIAVLAVLGLDHIPRSPALTTSRDPFETTETPTRPQRQQLSGHLSAHPSRSRHQGASLEPALDRPPRLVSFTLTDGLNPFSATGHKPTLLSQYWHPQPAAALVSATEMVGSTALSPDVQQAVTPQQVLVASLVVVPAT